MRLHETARACPLFQDLTLDESEELLALFRNDRFPAGETILREGRSTQFLWVVVTGTCEVLKTDRNGAEQALALLEAGAVFGEMSFFHPAPHSASVRAKTDVDVMRLARNDYDRLCEEGSAVPLKLLANTLTVVSERLRRMDDWVGDFVDRRAADGHREEWRDFRSKLYAEWKF